MFKLHFQAAKHLQSHMNYFFTCVLKSIFKYHQSLPLASLLLSLQWVQPHWVYNGFNLNEFTMGATSLSLQWVQPHWVYNGFNLNEFTMGATSLSLQWVQPQWVYNGFNLIEFTMGATSLSLQWVQPHWVYNGFNLMIEFTMGATSLSLAFHWYINIYFTSLGQGQSFPKLFIETIIILICCGPFLTQIL